MRNPNAMRATGMAMLALSLFTYGCNKPPEKADAGKQAAEASGPSAKAGNKDEKLRFMAAAEPFEALTEAAATGDERRIQPAVNAALASGDRIRSTLPSTYRNELDFQTISIRRGQRAKDPTAISLSSNEAYRILVSASAGAASFPVEVSLLDYAGFRYDANLKAKPARWADMTEATLFAERQWAQVEPRLKEPALAAEFGKALTDMKKAAATKDGKLAAASVKAELDLVDKLEAAFAKNP